MYLLHKVYNDEAGAVAVGQQAKGHVESESGDGRRRLQVDPRGQTAEQCKVKLCKKYWTKRRSIYIHTRYLSVSSANMRFWTKQKMSQGCQESATKAIIRQADIIRKSGGYPDKCVCTEIQWYFLLSIKKRYIKKWILYSTMYNVWECLIHEKCLINYVINAMFTWAVAENQQVSSTDHYAPIIYFIKYYVISWRKRSLHYSIKKKKNIACTTFISKRT